MANSVLNTVVKGMVVVFVLWTAVAIVWFLDRSAMFGQKSELVLFTGQGKRGEGLAVCADFIPVCGSTAVDVRRGFGRRQGIGSQIPGKGGGYHVGGGLRCDPQEPLVFLF